MSKTEEDLREVKDNAVGFLGKAKKRIVSGVKSGVKKALQPAFSLSIESTRKVTNKLLELTGLKDKSMLDISTLDIIPGHETYVMTEDEKKDRKKEILKEHPEYGKPLKEVVSEDIDRTSMEVAQKLGLENKSFSQVLKEETGYSSLGEMIQKMPQDVYSNLKNTLKAQNGSAPLNPKAASQNTRITKKVENKKPKDKTKTESANTNTTGNKKIASRITQESYQQR